MYDICYGLAADLQVTTATVVDAENSVASARGSSQLMGHGQIDQQLQIRATHGAMFRAAAPQLRERGGAQLAMATSE